MRRLTLLLSILFFAGCSQEKEGSNFNLENFSRTYSSVRVLRGDVFRGNPVKAITGRWLSVDGEIVSTGDGEAEITHENGVVIHLDSVSKTLIKKDMAVITGGSAVIDFPASFMGETSWKGWKLRAKGSSIQLVNGERSSMNVFRGELLAEKDGKRFLVKEGNALFLLPSPSIKPIKWWEPGNGESQWEEDDENNLVPGQGVLGARRAGTKGKAHLPLLINSMKINVEVVGDLAVTTITQEFYNPTRDTLEGIYRFEAPKGAMINGFAVDRQGKLVYGIIKGKTLAKIQYQSNVYAGSTEDPALLEHEEGRRYRAFIYPIKAGEKRKVLIRYTTWMERSGETRNHRSYHLPLVGNDNRSPEYGELDLTVDLSQSRARFAKANLGVTPDGTLLELKATDFISTSDFNLQLEDDGMEGTTSSGWYTRPAGRKGDSIKRGDYFFARLYPLSVSEEKSRNVDLLMVVDFSADTTRSQISLARLAVETAVSTLRKGDRMAIVSGDLGLRESNIQFLEAGKSDPVGILEKLAREKKGGATDILELITQAGKLFPSENQARAGILLYIGNGKPTVGELKPESLAEKWHQLPYNIGFRAIATSDGEGLEVLKRLSQDVSPLLLSEVGVLRELPSFINDFRKPRIHNLSVSLNGNVGKFFPKDEILYEAGKVLNVSGKMTGGKLPSSIILKGEKDSRPWSRTFSVEWNRFTDVREIARRWANEELKALQLAGASGEEILDLGMRFEIVTPYTSLYVPTLKEAQEMGLNLEDKEDDSRNLEKDEEKSVALTEKNKDFAAEPKRDKSVRREKLLKSFSQENEGAAPTGTLSSGGSIYKSEKKAKRSPRRSHRGTSRVYSDSTSSGQGYGQQKGGKLSGVFDNKNMPAEIPAAKFNARTKKPSSSLKIDDRSVMSADSGIGIGGGGGLGGRFGSMGGYNFNVRVRSMPPTVIGKIDRNEVWAVTRAHRREVHHCYQKVLMENELLAGSVGVKMVLARGRVISCKPFMSFHKKLGNCICSRAMTWKYPRPEKGKVRMTQLWMFSNTKKVTGYAKSVSPAVTGFGGSGSQIFPTSRGNTYNTYNLFFCRDCNFQRKPDPCSAASKLPLWQRRNLWKERIGARGINSIIEVYNDARKLCELPSPHSKMVFLRLSISMLPDVNNLLRFYRRFVPSYGYSAFLKSAILARIKTVQELLKVRASLGLSQTTSRTKIMDILEKETSAEKKIMVLKKLIKSNKSDSWLKILLLNIFEDKKMKIRAKNLISEFYGNPMLDEELRLETAEYLIRNGDTKNARRLLSELVEFAPSNPQRRRILGTLYMAYGWYKLAVRELTSLMSLSAGSSESKLLLAMAYEYSGEHEKSLGLIEEILTKSEPGSDIVKTARIVASRHLAGMLLAGKNKNHSGIHDRGTSMALYRNDESQKIILSYLHPRSDLEFTWGISEENMLRVPFLKPGWGVEGVISSKLPDVIHLRVSRTSKTARNPVNAQLTIILNEGKPTEKIIIRQLKFDSAKSEYKLTLTKGELK